MRSVIRYLNTVYLRYVAVAKKHIIPIIPRIANPVAGEYMFPPDFLDLFYLRAKFTKIKALPTFAILWYNKI